MLTKSDLQSFRQCSRKVWLEHHDPDAAGESADGPGRREMDGNVVGEMARRALGDEFIWPPGGADPTQAAEDAKRLLTQSPHLSAAEVPMVHNGLYARADALVRHGLGYILRETKASTFPVKADKVRPGKPKDHHLDDVAIQAWALIGTGLPMTWAELNLLDGQWRYPGGGDYAGLFRQMDVTAEIADRVKAVPGWIEEAEMILAAGRPAVEMGEQCRKPYDCPFQAYCSAISPPAVSHPIELLPGQAGKALARKLRESKGYTSILEPAPEDLTGVKAALYRRIQEAHRTGQAILEPGSVDIMTGFPYPRYFFDFEGIDLAVPRWPGVRPYDQVPFQWSCHIEHGPGHFTHEEFLDLTGDDPSLPCIVRMIEAIDPDGVSPIFVYFATYEAGRMNDLADRHPAHAVTMEKYVARLVDLLPIVQNHFYHPAMAGSFSIKKVLPVVAPDLNYEALDEVQDGTSAQIAYIEAALNAQCPPERRAAIDENLRRYCRQDTWAMVEIAYFLAQVARPFRPEGA